MCILYAKTHMRLISTACIMYDGTASFENLVNTINVFLAIAISSYARASVDCQQRKGTVHEGARIRHKQCLI